MRKKSETHTGAKSIPPEYSLGDSLNWEAPWIEVDLGVELPFWLMFDNANIHAVVNGHEFQIAVHDNYFDLNAGLVADSGCHVVYRGPLKKEECLSEDIRALRMANPKAPFMWRKCKTVLKVKSRCNEDVWNAANSDDRHRLIEARVYLGELCKAHIPVINCLIQKYRLATYDYFAFEVSPWDVPRWNVQRGQGAVSSSLLPYKTWDVKPPVKPLKGPVVPYQLISGEEMASSASVLPSPGECEVLDALNLMERGDYTGAIRRITTAIEVIVEAKAGEAVERTEGAQAAAKFLKNTRMNFDNRVKTYENVSGRHLTAHDMALLKETRSLRHRIVHGGYRLASGEKGLAQRLVDMNRWLFNRLENDPGRAKTRETRIAFRSLGRDLSYGVFISELTPDGVVLRPHDHADRQAKV